MTKAYENTKAWRLRHPDIRAYRAEEARKWRDSHPGKNAEIRRNYRSRNLERLRKEDAEKARIMRSDPRYRAKIRMQVSAKRLATQEAMAGRPKPSLCELFRGWLCDRCNKVLGIVKDSTTLLRKLADYLETHNGKNE